MARKAPSEEQREKRRKSQARYRATGAQKKDKGPCSIQPCPNRARARGMCTTHLERERRNGHPLLVKRCFAPGETDEERMWIQVREEGDCWLFTGFKNQYGYGQLGVDGRYVHRMAYEQMVGPIPEGLDLDHTCHNESDDCVGGNDCPHRACVNPDHLDPVSTSVNSSRRWDRERRIA